MILFRNTPCQFIPRIYRRCFFLCFVLVIVNFLVDSSEVITNTINEYWDNRMILLPLWSYLRDRKKMLLPNHNETQQSLIYVHNSWDIFVFRLASDRYHSLPMNYNPIYLQFMYKDVDTRLPKENVFSLYWFPELLGRKAIFQTAQNWTAKSNVAEGPLNLAIMQHIWWRQTTTEDGYSCELMACGEILPERFLREMWVAESFNKCWIRLCDRWLSNL